MTALETLIAKVTEEGAEITHVNDAVAEETKRVEDVIAALKAAPAAQDAAILAQVNVLQAHVDGLKTIQGSLAAVEPLPSPGPTPPPV